MQARVRVLDEQGHRLLRRACSDVAAVLLSEVVGAEVEAEVTLRAPPHAFSARISHMHTVSAREIPRPRTCTCMVIIV